MNFVSACVLGFTVALLATGCGGSLATLKLVKGVTAADSLAPYTRVDGVVTRGSERLPVQTAAQLQPGDTLAEVRIRGPALLVERAGFPIPPTVGTKLQKGDIVTTGRSTTVVLDFHNALVVVQPNSKVTLGSIFTWFGEVFISGWVKTDTDYATAAVEGTEYAVRVDPETCTTSVTVVHGSVIVSPVIARRGLQGCGGKGIEPGQPSPAATGRPLQAGTRVLVGERASIADAAKTTPNPGPKLTKAPADAAEFNRLVVLANSTLGTSGGPRVPMFLGLDEKLARDLVARSELKAVWQVAVAPGASGKVVRQSVAAGGRASSLTLWIGAPPPAAKILDQDRDGVPDDKDKCPKIPEDKDGTEDADGCPEPDQATQLEPAKFPCSPMSTYDGFRDNDCNDRHKVIISVNEVVILDKVQFETQSAVLLPQSNAQLDWVAATLRGHPEFELMEIAGHADERGNDDMNLRLTQARARAVLEALVRRGVARARLYSVGYGELCPVDDRSNPAAWEKNRRVEYKVVRTDEGFTGVVRGCEQARHLVRKLPEP